MNNNHSLHKDGVTSPTVPVVRAIPDNCNFVDHHTTITTSIHSDNIDKDTSSKSTATGDNHNEDSHNEAQQCDNNKSTYNYDHIAYAEDQYDNNDDNDDQNVGSNDNDCDNYGDY